MNKEMICKNCKYHYIEEISFDYPQSCCSKRNATTEGWCKCNAFEYSDRYIEQLQQENKQLKERVNYLERSNNRREDTILEQRQEISNLEDNWNNLKKWIDSEIENRDSEDLLKLYVELQEDNETLLSRIRGYKSQQKEFMTFLEDNWKETQDIWYIKILNKYKEIIGE